MDENVIASRNAISKSHYLRQPQCDFKIALPQTVVTRFSNRTTSGQMTEEPTVLDFVKSLLRGKPLPIPGGEPKTSHPTPGVADDAPADYELSSIPPPPPPVSPSAELPVSPAPAPPVSPSAELPVSHAPAPPVSPSAELPVSPDRKSVV